MGSPRRHEGGGGRFLLKIPGGGGGGRGRGRGAGTVSAANWGIGGGGGAKYFFSGQNVHQVSLKKTLALNDTSDEKSLRYLSMWSTV